MSWTPSEMMVVAASRGLAGERVCFVGIGLPNLACSLAKRIGNPGLELVYESGVIGAEPARLPLSIGDPTLVSGAIGVTSMFDLFAFFLQAGRIDVAFLGAAQIDRNGTINTTVIGDYTKPKVRLPGSGGACEISISARKTFVILNQSPRSFVDRVDFVTSPGHLTGGRPSSWPGRGPQMVITQLGVYRFDNGEMVLESIHPGVDVNQARAATGWDLSVASDLAETGPPSEVELEALRSLDPDRVYLR